MKLSKEIVAIAGGVGALCAGAAVAAVKIFHPKTPSTSSGDGSSESPESVHCDDGFDKKGFDGEGFNRDGFDRFGFDRNGCNRHGFNRDGFNCNGFDRAGYDKNGYNASGTDRAGRDRKYYSDRASQIIGLANKAHEQMKQCEFPYALHDIREGLECAIQCLIWHWKGESSYKGKLSKDVKTCERYLGKEMSGKVRRAINHCNDTQHFNEPATHEKTYDQVHFCYMTLLETADMVRNLSEEQLRFKDARHF